MYEKYKNKVILNSDKKYAEKNDKNKEGWINNSLLTKEAVIDGVIDMYLLSKTNFKIYNKTSSYAQLVKIIQG